MEPCLVIAVSGSHGLLTIIVINSSGISPHQINTYNLCSILIYSIYTLPDGHLVKINVGIKQQLLRQIPITITIQLLWQYQSPKWVFTQGRFFIDNAVNMLWMKVLLFAISQGKISLGYKYIGNHGAQHFSQGIVDSFQWNRPL